MDMSFLNLPKPILAMRFMNVLSAFMLSFCAITKLMTTDRLAPGIVAVYIFIFAVAIFLFELHIPQLGRGLAENLGFLYSAMGRFWFLILVAILAASGHGLVGHLHGHSGGVHGRRERRHLVEVPRLREGLPHRRPRPGRGIPPCGKITMPLYTTSLGGARSRRPGAPPRGPPRSALVLFQNRRSASARRSGTRRP